MALRPEDVIGNYRYQNCSDDEKKCNEKIYDEGTDVAKIEQVSADFETAISHAGYGFYNKRMLAFYVPATLSTLFCLTAASFVMPAARCLFHLTPVEEGLLFGAPYIGMVSSAFAWGFFIDTLGRQNLLFYGLLCSAITEFLAGLAQHYWVYVVVKIFNGVAICGPFSLVFTYLSEFYGTKQRDKIVMCAGGFTTFAYILQPFLAYFLIPMDISYKFFNGKMVIDNWRIFELTGSFIIFLAAFLVYFMDESPKFLMAVGRNNEALNVFRKIYSVNTGNPPESYPVKVLKSEISEEQNLKSMPSESVMDYMKKGWTQIKPLFMHPYLTPCFLISMLLCLTMMTLGTFRLRLPRIFASMITAEGNITFTVCESLQRNTTYATSSVCIGTHALVDPEVYVNSLIIGTTTFSMFWVAIYITKYMDKNHIYIILSITSALGMSMFPWTNGIVTIIFSAAYVAIMNVNMTLVISMSAASVPTTLRGMAINIAVMLGRLGVFLGNVVVPLLAAINCELQYFTMALFHFGTNIESDPADFETAISHTGYGLYHKRMLVCYVPATMKTLFCLTAASLVMPAARCLFHLTPVQEGLVFGAPYIGMVSSTFAWGFFVDTLGRQNLLFYGLLFTTITEFLARLAQYYWVYVVIKIFNGVAVCGPYALIFTFLSEFYGTKQRDNIVMCVGGITTFAYILQPPFLVYFMDESPKFLIAVGRNNEALNVFRKIYSVNTGNPPESYPVKVLKSEISEEQNLKSMPSESVMDYMKKGWTQIKPLFVHPYLTPCFLISMLLCLTMMTLGTFRLRLPRIFASMITAEGNITFTVCESLQSITTYVTSSVCIGTHALVDPEVYVNSLIIGTTTFSMFWVAIYITKYMDKNHIYSKSRVYGN